jgi:copper chaperone CopZ
MKKTTKGLLVIGTILFHFALLQTSALAEEKKAKFTIENVTCLSIAYTAEGIPQELAGVHSSKFDFAEDGVIVVFDDSKISIPDISNAFEKENFPVVGDPVVME